MSITFYADGNYKDGPNFSNMNAEAILREMDIIQHHEDIWSINTASVATMLRGCMSVLNSDKLGNVRPKCNLNIVGKCQVHDEGLSEDGIRERVVRLQEWLKEMNNNGIKEIFWS